MGEHESKTAKIAPPSTKGQSNAPKAKQDRVETYLADAAISRRLQSAIETHLAHIDLLAPPRAEWVDEGRFVKAALGYMQPFGLFLKRDRLPELLFPTKPYDAIAPYVPRGFEWEPAIGVALAPLFEEAILGSLRRLGPKWIEYAENQPEPEALGDESISLVAETSLQPAHPMDLVVRRGLTTNRVLALKGMVLPAHKRRKLHAPRKVKVEWQITRDRKLWNFVRPDPADATAEEVAAALFASAFWRADGAVYAHRLTKVGTLFRVPEEMARRAGARELSASNGEQATRASAPQTTTIHSSDVKGRSLQPTLANSMTRLEHLKLALAPWKADQTIAIAVAWVESKQRMGQHDPNAAGTIVEQYELLGTILDKLRPFEDKKMSADELGVLRPTMMLYARAVASSHLGPTCRNLIASAEGKQTDLIIESLRTATIDMVATTGQGNQHTTALAARSRQLQTELLKTGATNSEDVEVALVGMEEAALDARLSALHAQAKQLRDYAMEASSIFVITHTSFEQVKRTARWLTDQVDVIRNSWSSETKAQAGVPLSAWLQVRAASLKRAQDSFKSIRQEEDVIDLLKHGAEVIRDHQTYVQWTKLFVDLAITIGTMVIPPLGASRVASMVARMATGSGWLARGGRLLAAGIEIGARPAAEIAVSTGTQVVLHGGSLPDALLENTLQTLASAVIMRRLGGSLELSRKVERETAKLWSARTRAGALILEQGVTISAHMVLNVATAWVARQITQRVLPVHAVSGGDSGGLEDVFMQGASLALGRYVHGKLEASKQLDSKLVRHPKGADVDRHRARLLQLADLAEKSPRPTHAVDILAELAALRSAQRAVLADIGNYNLGIDKIEAAYQAKQLEKGSDLQGEGLHSLPLREQHLEEVIPGKHWSGSREQINRALKSARRVFAVKEHDTTGKRRVTIDNHELILEETSVDVPKRPTSGPQRTPTERSSKASPASTVTRAELVPGSEFRGRGSGVAIVGQERAFESLDAVLRSRDGVTHIDHLPGGTILVRLAPDAKGQQRNLTIRIEVAPLEGQTVARSWVNSTQQGFSQVGNESVRVLGRHVVQLSNELDAVHADRAVSHEVAEIFEVDRLNFAGEYAKPDALRPGGTGKELSPHDIGRLAEVEVLARSTLGNPEIELHAMVEHLGLREGTTGAAERLRLASKHLSKSAAQKLTDASKAPTGEIETRLAALRARAATDHANEQAAASKRDHAGPEMPSLTDATGKALTGEALTKRVAAAEKARAEKSQETWSALRGMHVEKGFPTLPYPVMIGGGASLAARDRAYLLVDDRGRWHADGNIEIAQTSNQLKHTADAKLGDPRKHAAPNERLSLDAVRAWEDEIAVQGPVINGRANLRFGPHGESLIDLTVGGETRTFILPSDPLIATGFVPERIPGAPFGLRPSDAARGLREELEIASNNTELGPDLQDAARRAVAKLDAAPIVTNQDTVRFLEILDPALRTAMANNPALIKGLAYGEAAKNWLDLVSRDDPNHPHVFFGDQANLGRAQAMNSNNWVIAGTGGTGVSAAEIVLKNNPKARVVMVGPDSPAGLLENDQFRMLAEHHADKSLAASMGITKPTSERLSIRQGRVAGPVPSEHAQHTQLVDESGLDAKARAKRVIDINGTTPDGKTPIHIEGTAYVASIGRNNDYPATVLQLIDQVRKLPGGNYFVQPLFHDRQYVGYRVRFTAGGKTIRSVDVTGAASRYLPHEDAIKHADPEVLKSLDEAQHAFGRVRKASEWDAPAESGNFAGGFAATATQASRYAVHRTESRKGP